jgi:transposase
MVNGTTLSPEGDQTDDAVIRARALTALDKREEQHPKAACTLMASKRYGRYLSTDRHGRPKLDAAKVKAAEKFDGKFVVITNDDTLSAEDVALAYKAGAMIESCFRRMKQTGLEVRPMFIGRRGESRRM